MDDAIRIEKVPGYPQTVRENGKSEDRRKDDKDHRKRKRKQDEISDGHIDTVAMGGAQPGNNA